MVTICYRDTGRAAEGRWVNPSLSAFNPSVGSSESYPRWALFLMVRVAASGSDRLWCHEIRVDHPRWSC
jgi:hypothetical protein